MNVVIHKWKVPPGGPFPGDWCRVNRDVERWFNFERDYDLTILLSNLAVAGALCAAWTDGWKSRDDFGCSRSWPDSYWHPGCGREVPR